MLTVTELGRRYNLSRATILYYEKEGLLTPAQRSANGYRWYGEAEQRRLESIVSYRAYGLPLASIKGLIESDEGNQSRVLKAHFHQLEVEISKLKQQQRAIVAVLQEPALLANQDMNKERWVEIMRASGFDDDAMWNWHQRFEAMEPKGHQRFLESLGIDAEEVEAIRMHSGGSSE